MIRIGRLTDYAIVIASYCAHLPDRVHSAAEIAEQVGIQLPTVRKILKRLTRVGIFRSVRGVQGGYRLARPPEEISLAEIITAMEGPIGLTVCSAGIECEQAPRCPMQSHWQLISQTVERALEAVKLDQLREVPIQMVKDPKSLRAEATVERGGSR